ncbi:penicillin acylase family protein [Nocardioides albidus]|uniref:Penicillin acylase family protein n=1 Tax=Nocardioides albidus TaxID=1517589 RepID=A0A5C4VL20_9ACTN|nr:penicillin acylase family protein [Nocardioides albidus]TNM36467.1 penicillin acylase family protein [Nocardioides albidus]
MVDHDTGADAPPAKPSSPSWSRWVRWTTAVGVLLAIVLVAALTTAVVGVRRSWPQTGGELAISGLEAEVRVGRDDHGIPQIYADSTHDLMLAQGFVHAQDRFYEMDVRRHATAGRLSELFGDAGLETDLVVRTLGWRDVAEKELGLLKPATRSALDAYAEGVNAYLEGRSSSEMSLEYTLLGITGLDYQPEKWSAVDSVAWLKAMAWDLRGNLEEEIGRAVATATVGATRAEDLYPAYPYDERPPVVQQGGVADGVFDQDASGAGAGSLARPPVGGAGAVRALAKVHDVLAGVPALLGRGDGLGSNAWVVDGDHTESGAPILANDPHLGISLPGVWTQVGLHCRTLSPECPYDVAGFSFSGVPGVVIGHNREIAWGFTNLGPDVTDLYVERVTGDEWEYDGQQLPLTRRTERIQVRDGEDVELTVRSTSHGPLLSDLARFADEDGIELTEDGLLDQVDAVADGRQDESAGDVAISLAWTALTPRPTADALLALDRAGDWTSFRKALSAFAVPGQNVVYADTEGHIGYQATGLVPIRRPGNDGRLPAAGWSKDTAWTGEFVPYDALPNVLDPDSGIIATANQAVIDPDRYPPHLTADWDQGYRSERIAQLLAADDELSVEAMSAIQLDDRSAIGEALTPYLLDVDLPRGYYSDGQRLLRSWNYQQDPDSAAAAYFNVVWRELLARTFSDELPKVIQADGGHRWFSVVETLLRRGRSPWWDDVRTDDKIERRSDILREAMVAARDELTALESPSAEEWTWGALHELELRSSTLGESGIGIVERLFNRGGWEVGGGGSLVDATAWDAREGYDVVTAPSMRMVVPMDDLDAARWINLTGASGHAFHPHYTDQTDLWARGETLPWVFSEQAVRRAAEDTLLLTPEG